MFGTLTVDDVYQHLSTEQRIQKTELIAHFGAHLTGALQEIEPRAPFFRRRPRLANKADQVAQQRRWPGGDHRTVADVFAEEQPRLLPAALHPFSTDRIETVCSRKTIYVRFDLNDYLIPPEAVGRQLTLLASDTSVRILDGSVEIARHVRSYDRHQPVLDPAHQDAVLKIKRKAFHSTPVGRLEQAAPDSKTLLDLAFAQGESAGSQTAQLMKLLDQYGPAALRRAIAEALQRNTPRASSVAFLLRRQPRSTLLAVDLSRHPQAQSVDVRPHDLETYDELTRTQNNPGDDDSNGEQ